MSYMRMQEGENALEFLDKMGRLRDQLLEMGGGGGGGGGGLNAGK